ncbi:hypothetical protein ACFO4O_07875 [Glaciecola siphonariae]|uniref:Uncharacterized protein n=1 Tax=Glaciecola siphonariae TaxID=521012 RepID=A0ABV9LX94_9ALTE
MSTLSSSAFSTFASTGARWLDAIDRAVWPVQSEVDNETLTHYFYQRYPKNLSTDELKQWCQLQAEVLAPFPTSYHYMHRSAQGLHVWFSPSPLNGIPETAAQSAMSNGRHVVKGERYHYLQTWQDNILISCFELQHPSQQQTQDAVDIPTQHYGWASERKLASHAKTPLFWAGVSSVLFVVTMLFIAGSALMTSSQTALLSAKSDELSELVGPKLNEQSTLTAYVNRVNHITGLQRENAFLPEAIAIAFTLLPSSQRITVQSILWQNNSLNLDIQGNAIDITSIIAEAENNEQILRANIRPQGNEDTWVLEVAFQ